MGNSSRKIQGYKVTEKLGGGCFGTVYKTKSKTNAYAIKEIYRGKSSSDVEKLKREANIHENLPYHRNIVRFIECFRHDYKMYIVLEFCALGSLNDYVISHDGSTSDKTLLYIMFDLARGLQHMHRHNIVHRDIKPDNVLLSQGKFGIPTCKICDFGLARRCERDGSVGQEEGSDGPASDDGPMMYMAPEITSGTYTASCDVFSLGVLYFVLFSRQVTEFKGRRLLEPHINGYPIFSATDSVVERETRRHVQGQCDPQLIICMLRKVPNHRCSVADVLDKLHVMFARAITKDPSEQYTEVKVESNGHLC